MGYTTEFDGAFWFNKKVTDDFKEYINNFCCTRHMKMDVEKIKQDLPFWRMLGFDGKLGPDGAFILDFDNIWEGRRKYVLDFNNNEYCPGIWCQWEITKDNEHLQWDGAEKFYNYKEWLEFLAENFFEPKGYKLSGVLYYWGEEEGDVGYLIANDNNFYDFNAIDYDNVELANRFSSNPELSKKILEGFDSEKIQKVWKDRYGDDYEI